MVLEKAFAKYMGSYAATEGGYPLFAMKTITGIMLHAFFMVFYEYQDICCLWPIM